MSAPTHSRRKIHDPGVSVLREAMTSQRSAVEYLEETRWGDEPACPRRSSKDVYRMSCRTSGERRPEFRWRCRSCKQRYTVRTGAVMEESRLPLRYWAFAFWKVSASKKGVSALQVSRELDVNYKSALFLLNRVRLAMSDWGLKVVKRLGGKGKTVEADETYVGGKPRYKGQSPPGRSRFLSGPYGAGFKQPDPAPPGKGTLSCVRESGFAAGLFVNQTVPS